MGLQDDPLDLNANDSSQGHLRNYSSLSLKADIASAGLRVVHERGLYLKLVPNSMMLSWNENLLRGINDLAKNRLDEAAELFMVCEK